MSNSTRRDRGRMLTEAGWRKIWDVIYQEFPDRQTFAAIARKTDPSLNAKAIAFVTAETIAKIVNRKGGADKSKIHALFAAFELTLEPEDHVSVHSGHPISADPNFVGRGEAIAHLHELLHREAKVIVIQARGGVGKTTLARKFLNQEFDTVLEFPIAKETKDIASIESLLEEKLRQLGEEPGREFMVSCDRLKRKLQSDRIGILIDNLEPALDSSGRFIEPHRRYVEVLRILADPSVQSTTLITTRERLRESSITVQTYLLKSLDVGAWKEFFESHTLATDTPALAALHNAYGGNAKAMEIISGAIAQDFDGDVDAYWQENQDDLFIERDLEDLVKQQFERLKEQNLDAYNLLCRMGCYRYQDVPTVPIEGLFCLMWDVPEKAHKRVIKILRDRSLAESKRQEYWLHPIIREEALLRLRFDKVYEKSNLITAEFWTNKIKFIEDITDALEAFEAYYHYLEISRFTSAAHVMLRQRSCNLPDLEGLGRSFYKLGLVQQLKSAIKMIIPNISSAQAQELGELYSMLGITYQMEGQIHKAIELHQKAQKIAHQFSEEQYKDHDLILRSGKFRDRELGAILSIGICKIELWELLEALQIFEDLYSRTNDANKVFIMIAMAFIYSNIKNIEKAVYFSKKSVRKIQKYNQRSTGYGLFYLGSTYKNIGNINEAYRIYETVISYAENSHYIQVKSRAVNGMAELYRIQEKFDDAILCHLRALEDLEKIGIKVDMAEVHYQLGLTYNAIEDYEKSAKNFHRAIQLFTEIEAPRQIEKVQRSIIA